MPLRVTHGFGVYSLAGPGFKFLFGRGCDGLKSFWFPVGHRADVKIRGGRHNVWIWEKCSSKWFVKLSLQHENRVFSIVQLLIVYFVIFVLL